RYAARLVEHGFAQRVTLRSLGVVGDLMNWMASSRFKVADIDEPMVERFLRNRARKAAHLLGRPPGIEAVPVGAARCWSHRASRATADHPTGSDILELRRLSPKRTRFGAEEHYQAFARDPPVPL